MFLLVYPYSDYKFNCLLVFYRGDSSLKVFKPGEFYLTVGKFLLLTGYVDEKLGFLKVKLELVLIKAGILILLLAFCFLQS